VLQGYLNLYLPYFKDFVCEATSKNCHELVGSVTYKRGVWIGHWIDITRLHNSQSLALQPHTTVHSSQFTVHSSLQEAVVLTLRLPLSEPDVSASLSSLLRLLLELLELVLLSLELTSAYFWDQPLVPATWLYCVSA
jgi:hypothetical protein